MRKSALHKERVSYVPKLPKALQGPVKIKEGQVMEPADDKEEIKKLFPNTYGMPLVEFVQSDKPMKKDMNVGVILSGGQAPGGHNVICGLYDEVKKLGKNNRVYGFMMGPDGLIDHHYMEITEDIVNEYRNTGGFDMIGSGRTKLETEEQFEKGLSIMKDLDITALVIIGGDDSNTNSAILAEYYRKKKENIQVIGCPKTIDGDLKNDQIETSFGFDTATKTYAELIGNIQRDCNSGKKYWHFIKVMGRSASHVALECALKCQPSYCIISEEVQEKNLSLNSIVEDLCKTIAFRARKDRNYGTVIIPEGLIEFIPAIGRLIKELNELLINHGHEYKDLNSKSQRTYILDHLSPEGKSTFETLPEGVARVLSMERDPHGNVPVSSIETDRLIAEMCADKLYQWKQEGKYFGQFATQYHFLGYEGRCAYPSNFDANYCYSLGISAALLIAGGKTGYMAIVKNTTDTPENWQPGGVPITMMLNIEKRNGKNKPVIKKALVDLEGAPFKQFVSNRDAWSRDTCFIYPGPIQFWGPSDVCDITTHTLALEQKNK